MVGASSRLLSLLTNSTYLLHHRPVALFRLARRHSLIFPLTTLSAASNHLLHISPYNSLVPIKFSQKFYSRATDIVLQENNHVPANDYQVPPSHPWPEWCRLLESLSFAGYFNSEDEFAANENLSMTFVAAASSCLAFARDRPDILGSLPRKDIEVLIDDGYPFLFKSAHETIRRMRSFLQVEGSNEARSVDLMKYILSFASIPIIYPERNIKEATELSVRRLLQEMANLSYRGLSSEPQFQAVGRDEQMPRNLGPNITMKKGDWICPRCSFMNFSRNTKCLECEEMRPQREMTDGEWECPRCNFFNYRRNVVCLKCECRQPGEPTLPVSPMQTNTPSDRQPINSYYPNNSYDNANKFWAINNNLDTSHHHNQDRVLGKASNVSRTSYDNGNTFWATNNNLGTSHDHNQDHFLGNASNVSRTSYDNGNKFWATNKNLDTSHDHNQDQFLGNASNVSRTSYDNGNNFWATNKNLDTSRDHNQDRFLGNASNVSRTSYDNGNNFRATNKNLDTSRNQNQDRFLGNGSNASRTYGQNSGYGPFVPLSEQSSSRHTQNTDKKDQSETWFKKVKELHRVTDPESTISNEGVSQINHFEDNKKDDQLQPNNTNSTVNLNNGDGNSGPSRPETLTGGQQTPENNRSGWTGKSLEGSAVTEPDPLDMSEEAKAERWFRRVAQIKDISELSQIPDEDFPSIMPMRKGVNRFVVSKRKTPLERRLTSPQYRKNLRIMSSDPLKKEGGD